MKQALQQSTPLAETATELSCHAVEGESLEIESPISRGETTELRQEKLNAVRAAIASGAYDSEELLDKAMELMWQRLQDPDGLAFP